MPRRPAFDPDETLERIRELALALPEAYEEITWDDITLRVHRKIFALPGRGESLRVKADPDELEALLADPRFRPAPYLARGGWVAMDLRAAPLDWDEIRELIQTSYCLIAPKSLARQVSVPPGAAGAS